MATSDAPSSRIWGRTACRASSSITQYGHQWPRKKLITSGPPASRSAEVMICPSWFGKAKAGTRAPTPSARSACPDRRSSSVARCMISIADRGTLKGGAPDSKLALKASSRSCSVMNPPRVTPEPRVSKLASAGLCRDEPGQALRDDLACLGDQLTNNLTGRLHLMDQANALTRQQIHRIDIACGIRVRWEPHEPQHRHGLAPDDRPANHRLVRAGFLTTPLLAKPFPHECRLQGSVWSIRPAVTKKDSPNGVSLARLQHHLLVMRVGARFGTGQKPRAQHGGLRAECQDRDQTPAVRDTARGSDRPWGDGIHDPRNQS